MYLNCRWSAAWKAASSRCSTRSVLLAAPASTQAQPAAAHAFPRRACTGRRNAGSQTSRMGSLTPGFPPWWFPDLASAGSRELLFSQRRPNVIREEKAAGNKGAPEWESRGKVGPKILHRSFYRNGERKMKVFLKLIHGLQTLLVLMPLHSFLDSAPRPRISLHC